MAQANDSITVSPGAGVSIATQMGADNKEYQVLIEAGPSGHIIGTAPTYSVFTGLQAATANRNFISLYNSAGSGKLLRVRKIYIQPSGAAVTGVSQTWRVSRTTTAGAGGTAATFRVHDSVNAAPPAQITASYGTTTLPTVAYTYWEMSINNEETLPIWGVQPYYNILPTEGEYVSDYTLREGEGLMLQNITGLAYNYSVLAVCSVT